MKEVNLSVCIYTWYADQHPEWPTKPASLSHMVSVHQGSTDDCILFCLHQKAQALQASSFGFHICWVVNCPGSTFLVRCMHIACFQRYFFVCFFSKSNLTLRAVTCHLPCRRLSSQSCAFSSSHVWMWELDHKDGWAPKNWCFWIVVFEKCWGPLMDENLVARELTIRK